MSKYQRAVDAFPNEGDPPGLRQSTLSAFDSCALQSKFDVEYRKGWSGHPQSRGTMFHAFAAKAFREMVAQGEGRLEVDVALAILHECLRQDDLPADQVVPIPMKQVADLYWVVKKWAFDNEFNIQNLVDVEQRLKASVHYPDTDGSAVERVVSGQLDALLVEGDNLDHAICLDWKDTWALPGPTEVSFEGYFQQRFYAFLVLESYPAVQQVTLREFYVRYSEPREAVIYRDQLDDIRDEIAALVERFDRAYHHDAEAQAQHDELMAKAESLPEADVDLKERGPGEWSRFWKPAPGKQCGYCSRPTACTIFPTARREGRISSQDEAELVAGQVLVATAALAQSKEAVKVWIEKNGPLNVRDPKGKTEMGYRESIRTERPSKDKMEEAVAMGIDPASLYIEKKGTRFSQYRPDPKSDDLPDEFKELAS